MTRIELKQDEALKTGDVVELHFKSSGPQWWKAAIAAAIEARLSNRKDFTIRTVDYTQDGELIFTCVVGEVTPAPGQVQQASIVSVAIIAGAIVAVGLIFWLVEDKAYKIIDTPAAQNFSWAAIIIAGIVLVTFLRTGLKQ